MSHAQSTLEAGHAVHNGVHDAINGDQTSLPAVSVNGLNQKLNGAQSHNPLSPPSDSPPTPVSIAPPSDVKIDLDYQEQESDVRNEPMEIKPIDSFDKVAKDSVVAQVATPVDPASIPISPPNGTPLAAHDSLQDVKMAEQPASQPNGVHGTVNDAPTNGDIVMKDESGLRPPALSGDSSMATVASNNPSPYNTPRDRSGSGDEDDGQPPMKRPRILSDADKASLTHSATPPPVSASASNAASPIPPPPPSTSAATVTSMGSTSTAVPQSAGPVTLSVQQLKYCQSCIRSLKKMKDAAPFLKPVDPVALNIPHYPSIIKNPMDFSTIERKLNSSNPQKPDPNPENPRYHNADEFVADVRLIFTNCLTFNGPDHIVVQMGKRVEEVFDKQMKSMPPPAELKAPAPPKKATPPPPPPPVTAPPAIKKAPPARRLSTSVPVIRRNEAAEAVGRPKREIHPPPPKDLPYADAPKKHRKAKRPLDDGVLEQLRYCSKIIAELYKKAHYNIAHYFYEPVDWVKLDIPSYPKIIKKPMDLSTIKKKLDSQEYSSAQKFYEDFKLMLRNCYTFNPPGNPVCIAGHELQKVFDDKWKNLPPLRPQQISDDDDDDDEDDSEAERLRAIAMMEREIETMKGNLEALKSTTKPKEKKKKKKEKELPPPPVAKAPPKQTKAAPTKKKTKKPIADDDVLTFEQKKDLSETISKLEGAKLEKVINIIHEGVPEIRDSTEEIELEIDLLPAAVLTKLYNFVIRPLRQPAVKRNRTGKGTGTGGLKRKSMDEDVEAQKIRKLEERMALFDNAGASGSAQSVPARHDDSDHSSDSSSGSDSSGSDSE